jgi:hypothetical protein
MPLEEEDDDEGEHNISDDDAEEDHDIHEISDDVAEDDHDIYEISDDDAGQGQVVDDAGQGDSYFHGTCIFINKFSMNNTQIMHLKDFVDYYPDAPIPQYVYCLT